MTGGLRIAALVIAGVTAIAAACTDVTGSASQVLSIQFDTLPAPAVVVGDSLRDTTGVVALPVVRAFNYSGSQIASPVVRYSAADRGVTVDSITGIIRGDSVRASTVRIVATVGGLQAIQRIAITLRPDFVTAVNARDSITYSLVDTAANRSKALTVKVLHGPIAADSAVNAWIVSFALAAPTNPQAADLVDDAGRLSLVDTTDASGIGGRSIRLHPAFFSNKRDSVVVNATVKYRGAKISGSPVRLVLIARPPA